VKRAAGTGHEDVEVPAGCTVAELLATIAQRHGDELKDLLFDSTGAVRRSILVFVGDSQVTGDPRRELSESETVSIVTPISGG
jgi:molybdopterin converting factor small subunit